jgi:hypothetical protein
MSNTLSLLSLYFEGEHRTESVLNTWFTYKKELAVLGKKEMYLYLQNAFTGHRFGCNKFFE